MAWFRKTRRPKRPVGERKGGMPEGLWIKCNHCREIIYRKEVVRSSNVCPKCSYHFRISARARLEMLCDGGEWVDTGAIGHGLVVLVGVTHDDTPQRAEKLAGKIAGLRVFDDEAGVMNRSVTDVGGSVLVVSQFTLYGDTSRGRRPGWSAAARPEVAEPLVDAVVESLRGLGLEVATGRFRAEMRVELVNDGPVTLIIDI
jgi:D-tyrosyl-tRNA(Tyr) deacylase